MSTDLDDIVDVPTAAAILGIRNDSVMDLIRRNRLLPSRHIGTSNRGIWITTRAAIARYQAEKDIYLSRRRKT